MIERVWRAAILTALELAEQLVLAAPKRALDVTVCNAIDNVWRAAYRWGTSGGMRHEEHRRSRLAAAAIEKIQSGKKPR